MKKKLKIVFDRDGVFNELHSKVAEKLGFFVDLFKEYKIEKNEHFDEDMKKAIYNCFDDPQIFADVEPAKDYMRIGELRQFEHVHLIVHSLSSTALIAQTKKEWDKKHGIDFFHEYIDSFGRKKEMLEAFVQVEDCLENLQNSPAKYKVLINKLYNQKPLPKNTFRVNDLLEAVDVIKSLIENA